LSPEHAGCIFKERVKWRYAAWADGFGSFGDCSCV
jgi:hypothetical protein